MVQEHCDILLKSGSFLNQKMEAVPFEFIAITGGKISSICLGSDANQTSTRFPQADETIDCTGEFVMPGLTDGHIHTSQQLLRGKLLDEKPVIWKRINVPFESTLNEESSTLSAELAALEMIHSGTTSFVDVGGKYAESFASAYEASGLRGRLTYMTNDNPHMPENLRVSAKDSLKRLKSLSSSLSGRLKGYFSVTALTSASTEMIHDIFQAAKELGIPYTTHMNEYASEVFDFIEIYGCRPFVWLEKEGLLSSQFIAAHCIFLSEEEKDIIQQENIKVIHCPFSNCGKGIPETPTLLSRGISVGFGSDGSAHGGLDLFREMRLFRSLQNATTGARCADPQIMTAETVLQIATQGGAAALFEPNAGKILKDAPADLIVIDTTKPHLFPTNNLIHTIVESATGGDVKHMIVDGKLVMKNHAILTMDEEAILNKASYFLNKSL